MVFLCISHDLKIKTGFFPLFLLILVENFAKCQADQNEYFTEEYQPVTEEVLEEVYDSKCYEGEIERGVLDINDDKETPPMDKSIFFLETTCKTGFDFELILNARQACAVESAAQLHPDRKVYLLYSYPIRYPNQLNNYTRNYKIVNKLLEYENIKIRRVNLTRLAQGTPLDDWYYEKNLKTSLFSVAHTSDVLRYLLLWKYGGTYMDLDVIVMKSLDDLGYNFAGIEEDNSVNNAVLNFEHGNIGMTLAERCLGEIRDAYKSQKYSSNGPRLITKMLQLLCDTESVFKMTTGVCQGFKVLSPTAFYPLSWIQWQDYFDPLKLNLVLSKVNNSYSIHLWNRSSRKKTIYPRAEPVAYTVLAEKFCPKIYTTNFRACSKWYYTYNYY